MAIARGSQGSPRGAAATSLTRETAAVLRGLIAAGQIRPGERLPSERALAARLKVSRVTVVRALARLRLEGIVVTRHGSGSYVATTDRLLDTVAPLPARPEGPAAVAPDALDIRWATTAGPAELNQLAIDALHDAMPAALRGDGGAGETADEVTERLADYLTRSGLRTRASQLTLTAGAMVGFGLVLDVAGPPARLAVTDTPTYPAALRVLARRNYRIRGWPAGPAHWHPERLASLLRSGGPGVLYLQPDGHNPTGATLPPGTREAVLSATRAAGWLTVADETMRPLYLTTAPARSLAARDSRVIVIGSLSKTVWGGLHLGWIRADAATTSRLRTAAAAVGAGPSALDQITAARLFPSLDVISERRARLLAANLQHLESRLRSISRTEVSWHTPTGGITIWLDLYACSSSQVVRQCARLGLLLEPASTYTVGGRDDQHIRIPFTLPPAALDRVADVLSRALDQVLTAGPGGQLGSCA
jgi:DNA-binding transcriptional MocR family regulator